MTLTSPAYTTLVKTLKQRIQQAQTRAALAISKELLRVYWLTGRDIAQQQAQQDWGSSAIKQLANDLAREFPGIEGFSARNLWRMKAFYLAYPDDDKLVPQAVAELEEPYLPNTIIPLPWGHHIALIEKVKDEQVRQWYARAALEHGWSRAILIHQIEGNLFDRQGKAVTNFQQTLPPVQSDLAQQILKDPYNFDFLTLRQKAHEREVEAALIENIQHFLLELGVGFSFVGSQYHLDIGGQDFYIDLLFYHIKLRCFVVIDLKMKEFKPEYAGKMNFYLSAVDDILKHESDEPTIGIVLCKENNKLIAEYALRDVNKPMGIATYLTESLPENLKNSLPDIESLEASLAEIDRPKAGDDDSS